MKNGYNIISGIVRYTFSVQQYMFAQASNFFFSYAVRRPQCQKKE